MPGYAKTFLKDVILRIDFVSPVPAINISLPKSVTTIISKYFPIAEPRNIQEISFGLPGEAEKKQGVEKDWVFHGKQREKLLSIVTNAMYIKMTVYTSFEDLKQQFVDIADVLFREFPDIQGRRLGLRYINQLNLRGEDPFNWKLYLNKNLLSMFNVQQDKKRIIRAISTMELNYEDDFRLRFTYGMHNPDYPATIKKKQFVLDYDAFSEGFLTKDDIIQNIDLFHAEIQNLFENSITDKLRDVMKKG